MRSTVFGRVSTALLACTLASGGGAAAQSAPGGEEPTLFERLGGLEGITIVVHDFMDAFIDDPLILANPEVRERKSRDRLPFLSYQVVTLVCEVTGGPCSYVGPSLAEAHDGLGISEAEWERMGSIFVETMNRHEVPQAEQQELLGIMGGTKEDIVVTER